MEQHAAARLDGSLLANLPYKVAGDAHWAAAGSTNLAGPYALPERQATRTSAGEPLNVSVYDLAVDAEHALRDFAQRFGDEEAVPAGRTALVSYAAGLADSNPDAGAEYRIEQLTTALRTALTIGDAEELLGEMTCPKCLGWTLVGVRNVSGAWQITCFNRRCAQDPADGRPDDPHSAADQPAHRLVPRSWSLRKIVRHHLYGRTA